MKVSDIHKAFKVIMDKNSEAIAFGGCPAFLSEEIDLFLNQAYLEVISNKFTGMNTTQIGFEGSVKRIADLEKLIKTDSNISATLNTNSNVITINNFFGSGSSYNRMFYVTSVLHFKNSVSTCILVDHDQARKFLKAYNNDPWIDTPVSTLEDNKLQIYVDTHSMLGPYTVDITYVKFPMKISYTSPNTEIDEVPDRIMNEVINRAVVLALENIESKRTETKVQLNNLQE